MKLKGERRERESTKFTTKHRLFTQGWNAALSPTEIEIGDLEIIELSQ